MSFAVLNVGGSPATNINSSLLADINLTSQQSVQIQQILAELSTGILSPVEAKAQIAAIVASNQASGGSAGQASGSQSAPVQSAPTTLSSSNAASDPTQSFYELPLPQESLKGAVSSYTSTGAASETVFSAPQRVNAAA